MSGNPSLDGVRAKLDRAREHLTALESCLDTYTSGGHFKIVHDFDPDSGWNRLRLKVHVDPPGKQLALITGDIASNARGSLDYLVWQLVLRAETQSPGRHTAFPVVKDVKRWAAARRNQLRGVDPQWVAVIETLQPFNDFDPGLHPLAALDEMNNFSKHRLLPAAIHQAHKLEMSDLKVVGGMEYEFDNPMESFCDGAALFHLRRQDREKLEFPPVSIVLRVGFDDGTGNQWDNRDILDWIEPAIARFEPAFST